MVERCKRKGRNSHTHTHTHTWQCLQCHGRDTSDAREVGNTKTKNVQLCHPPQMAHTAAAPCLLAPHTQSDTAPAVHRAPAALPRVRRAASCLHRRRPTALRAHAPLCNHSVGTPSAVSDYVRSRLDDDDDDVEEVVGRCAHAGRALSQRRSFWSFGLAAATCARLLLLLASLESHSSW